RVISVSGGRAPGGVPAAGERTAAHRVPGVPQADFSEASERRRLPAQGKRLVRHRLQEQELQAGGEKDRRQVRVEKRREVRQKDGLQDGIEVRGFRLSPRA